MQKSVDNPARVSRWIITIKNPLSYYSARSRNRHQLTTAKVKRLRTYRARLADRVGDLRSARDELTQLTAQIVEKQGLVMALEGRAEQEVARATERLQEAELPADATEGQETGHRGLCGHP